MKLSGVMTHQLTYLQLCWLCLKDREYLCINLFVSRANFLTTLRSHLDVYLFLLFWVHFIGSVCRIETVHQLLCFKSKFPNHFVFTLGRYLILLFWV